MKKVSFEAGRRDEIAKNTSQHLPPATAPPIRTCEWLERITARVLTGVRIRERSPRQSHRVLSSPDDPHPSPDGYRLNGARARDPLSSQSRRNRIGNAGCYKLSTWVMVFLAAREAPSVLFSRAPQALFSRPSCSRPAEIGRASCRERV